jgi:hypothetical protein
MSVDGGEDGTLFDQYRYIRDAVALDWVGCCDHDNGNGRILLVDQPETYGCFLRARHVCRYVLLRTERQLS